jgi:hypothetical protein
MISVLTTRDLTKLIFKLWMACSSRVFAKNRVMFECRRSFPSDKGEGNEG